MPTLLHSRTASVLLAAASILAAACAADSSDPDGDGKNDVSDDVVAYPPEPGAIASPAYSIKAGTHQIFVQHFGEESFARFAMGKPTTLAIRINEPVKQVRTVPESLAADASFAGDTVLFEIREPRPIVLFINSQEKLFLFPDDDEAAPKLGAPDVVNVLDHGADKTGQLATAPIQAAIDEAASLSGGGTVVFPPGLYTTGTLSLKSHVTLYLMAGARIKGSRIATNYPIDPGRHERGSDTSITDADAKFAGEFMTFSRLLLIGEATDVHIAGHGTIDGDGAFVRQQLNAVPNLIRVRSSSNVTIRDVMLRDSAAWTLHLLDSDGVDITNVKILNDRNNLNTDGIDVDSSRNVNIERAFIYTKDDGVCLKGSNNSDLLADVENVTVTNSIVSSVDAALKLGTESRSARFHNVMFENNDVFDSDRAMSVVVRDGARYSDVTYKQIRVSVGVRHLVEQVIGIRANQATVLGTIENLTFDTIDAPHFTAPASNWTWYAQYRLSKPQANDPNIPVFEGADASHAVTGLTFRNFTVRGERLVDPESAARLAGLQIGDFVTDVSWE